MATLQRRDPSTLSRMERWLAHDVPHYVPREMAIASFLSTCTSTQRQELNYAWAALWARPNQRMPDDEDSWVTMFVRAGRGYGKTRTGAESTRRRVARGLARSVLLIAPTAADARDVMVENPDSGLLKVHPPEHRPKYQPSTRSLAWPNGAIGYVRSAEDPDSIRGLNTDWVWGDEPASWRYGEAAWDNAMLGLRLGSPHALLTGTPRPLAWLKKIEQAAGTIVRRGSTYENIANLAPQFIDLVLSRYENTRLGAQELHAEYLEDIEGALWRMAVIEASRIATWAQSEPWGSLAVALTLDARRAMGLGEYKPDPKERRPWEIWVGVDPPGETAECGIIVGTAPRNASGGRDHAVVLDDMTVEGPPEIWGARVVEAVRKYSAAGAVVESNQGGDMVRATIHAVDPNVKVEKVRAKDSKADRAEPVSTLYSRGWVHHLGHLPKLESQMTTWVPEPGSKSPDRLDALVHVITKLLRPQAANVAKISSPVR